MSHVGLGSSSRADSKYSGRLNGRLKLKHMAVLGDSLEQQVGRKTRNPQQAAVQKVVMRTAQGRNITHLMATTGALILDMMSLEIPRVATAGDRAPMVVARENLLADPRSDTRRDAVR